MSDSIWAGQIGLEWTPDLTTEKGLAEAKQILGEAVLEVLLKSKKETEEGRHSLVVTSIDVDAGIVNLESED